MYSGFKGTKGRWVAVQNNSYYDIVAVGHASRNLAFNILLFDSHTHDPLSLTDENKANAQLIATAPELLDGLCKVKAELLRCDILDERTEKFIDGLISKATTI